VPSGFAAYARICQPAADRDGTPATWEQVARTTGRQTNPLMQWDALTGSPDPLNPRGWLWPGSDPTRGHLVPELVSSEIPRREIRCRAVNVTTAACNLGPNAQAPIGSGNRALVRARQSRQRNWCVRCSVQVTLIGGSSQTWWRPNRLLGMRCSEANRCPHPPHASG